MNKNKRIERFLVSLVLAVLLFVTLPETAISGDAEYAVPEKSTVSLLLSDNTLLQGEKLTGLVQIDSNITTLGAQFSLSYNPKLVKVVDVVEGD